LWLCPKPCGAALLVGWQIALGAGIGALYFANCCPALWAIGIGLIAAAIAGLEIWRRRCRRTLCDVAAELAVVITVLVVPILGWLANLPILSTCLNPAVAAAVGIISGILTLILINCASKPDTVPDTTQQH
jgi:hypothetical protein